MKKITNIQLNIINILMPMGSLSFAWYLQIYQNVIPCSLCLLQRWGMYLALMFIIMSTIFSLLKWNKTALTFTLLSMLGNIFSLVMGIRNVWLQNLPADKVPACGLDIETLLEVVPFLDAIKQTFRGSGECAEKAWVFLGSSLAVWASIFFTFYLILQIIIVYKMTRNIKENG